MILDQINLMMKAASFPGGADPLAADLLAADLLAVTGAL